MKRLGGVRGTHKTKDFLSTPPFLLFLWPEFVANSWKHCLNLMHVVTFILPETAGWCLELTAVNKKRRRNLSRKAKNKVIQPEEVVTTTTTKVKKVKGTLLKGTAHSTVPAECLVADTSLALPLVSTRCRGAMLIEGAVNWRRYSRNDSAP